MPFTGSHPAAVLPFLRTRVPPSALVIGSVVPDLPMYLPLPVDIGFAHTLAGTVSVDVIVGLAAFGAWQELLGPALVDLAPAGLRRRLPPAGPRCRLTPPASQLRPSAARFALTVLGLVVGALTHVCWDSFTHGPLWGAQHIPWLTEQHGPLPGWAWAQHASTVAGAAILATWFAHWWRTHPPVAQATDDSVPATVRMGRLALVVVTAAGATYGVLAGLRGAPWEVEFTLFLVAIHGGTAAIVALTAIAVVARALRRS